MGLFDPLSLAEDQRCSRLIAQRARILREGEYISTEWQDAAIMESIAREVFDERVAAGASTGGGPAAVRAGEEFGAFQARLIAPWFQRMHPLRDQKEAAAQIIVLHEAGRIGYRDDVIGPQFREIKDHALLSSRRTGERLVPPLLTLRMIIALATPMPEGRRVPAFWILSYARPNDRPSSDHYRGWALDVAKYDGQNVHMRDPEQAFAGVTAVIRNLPAGRYQLGLPRPPTEGYFVSTMYPTEYDQTARYSGAGVPGPLSHRTDDVTRFPEFYDERGRFLPRFRRAGVRHPWGLSNPFLDRRQREGHAPGCIERDLELFESPSYLRRFQSAMAIAASRGATVEDLFPDKPNHLHISILQSVPAQRGRRQC
jgi:hypothetical protein